MDFIEKVEETIVSTGRAVADRAKEMAEVASLKSQIATCQDVIRKNYAELGKLYYETYGDNPESLFAKQCHAIENAKNGIQDLEQKIRERKNL